MFPAISSPECHVHFSNMFASQKKKKDTSRLVLPKSCGPYHPGCFISSTKVRLQPGCMLGLGTLRWRRRMDGWGEPWKFGEKIPANLDGFFPGFCDLCSVYCNGVPWWLVDYFLFIFFHSWDNCFWTLSNWIPPILTTDEVLLAKMDPGFKNSCF